MSYIDTYTMFAGDDGGYAEYLPDGSGRLVKVRAADGVHFERAGGDMIAREVLQVAEPGVRPDELEEEGEGRHGVSRVVARRATT